MMNQTVKSAEQAINNAAAKAMATASQAAQQLRTGLAGTLEGTMDAMKTEVDHVSSATRDAAAFVGHKVAKRPLTYTLAAGSAGMLVGLGLMAMFNRPRQKLN